jgi:hypothetical protein
MRPPAPSRRSRAHANAIVCASLGVVVGLGAAPSVLASAERSTDRPAGMAAAYPGWCRYSSAYLANADRLLVDR